jgi:cell wall-associated NlpC family hydrolase
MTNAFYRLSNWCAQSLARPRAIAHACALASLFIVACSAYAANTDARNGNTGAESAWSSSTIQASTISDSNEKTSATSDENAKSDTAATAKTASEATSDLILHALSLIGVRYKFGGNTVEGFDCSGFVRHLFQASFELDLPRASREISRLGETIDAKSLVPGDLVFYNTLRREFSHVGIYIGEGRFVHAPSRGKSVTIENMSASYWRKRFNGARRLVNESTLVRAVTLPRIEPADESRSE